MQISKKCINWSKLKVAEMLQILNTKILHRVMLYFLSNDKKQTNKKKTYRKKKKGVEKSLKERFFLSLIQRLNEYGNTIKHKLKTFSN